MAIRPKKLVPGTLITDTATAVYTVPTNTTTKVYEIVLCNNDTSNTISVDLHMVDSGGSAEAKNRLYLGGTGGLNLAPRETKVIALEERMTQGDSLVVKASTTAQVSIRVSGDELA